MSKKIKKRIVLTGAQGTGKTTLMNALAEDGTKMLSVAREQAIASGWSPETGSNSDYQKTLFKALHKALSSKKNYISDRGLSCVVAHSMNAAVSSLVKDNISKKVADSQYKKFIKFHIDNPDVLLVYVPIEFPIEDDGMRDANELQQKKIDFLIKNILDISGVDYITVTGTVEERKAQIEAALNK